MTTKHLTVIASSRDEPPGPRGRVFDDIEPLDFTLPPELEAHEPPEERGLARDGVRLMVSRGAEPLVSHHRFPAIVEALEPGDLLVINTSGTLDAALDATRADDTPLEIHISTHLPGDIWTLELRQPTPNGTLPFREGRAGEVIRLPASATATLLTPYATDRASLPAEGGVRLWLATLTLPCSLQ
ncbi:MAG TPA: S-adenosylmethionine:tRNA ribosyltransferase-isomerase, partial [Ktedonobacterales bacterium]|nr:S-adenosylmethionine:tRNA ribosyltransferase-isomerase [Ktedonobacterales bacterium]